MSKILLTKLKKGVKAKVVEIAGGALVNRRLSALGLRTGVSIVKLSTFVLKGPVTVKVGSTTIALGRSMAEKVVVEVGP